MRLMDLPRRIPLSVYTSSVERVVADLSSRPDVISVYQVGSVNNPGISDVDLWVVFADDAVVHSDPREKLDEDGRYLFTHHLFGICQTHFDQSLDYRFFHDFLLLHGEEQDLTWAGGAEQSADAAAVERQSALEYVVKAFFGFTVESSFRVIKVRNFLLHAKALMLDLDPLGFDQCVPELRNVLNQVLDLRDRWFSLNVGKDEIVTRYASLRQALEQGLIKYFEESRFCLPPDAETRIGVNSRICGAKQFGIDVGGFRLPAALLARHRRLFNLQRRFMNFDIRLPLCSAPLDQCLVERFEFIRKAVTYNKQNLPHFVPVPYGLPLFG